MFWMKGSGFPLSGIILYVNHSRRRRNITGRNDGELGHLFLSSVSIHGRRRGGATETGVVVC